jgi:hypothetical protein
LVIDAKGSLYTTLARFKPLRRLFYKRQNCNGKKHIIHSLNLLLEF